MTDQAPDPAALERNMLDAITAYLAAEDHTGQLTELRAVEIHAITDNGDLPSGERVAYRTGRTFADLLTLAAPLTGTGAADPPFARDRGAIRR